MFTLPNLLTVAHLTDPVYFVRLLHRIWDRFPGRKAKPTIGTGSFRLVAQQTESQPYNRKFLKWEIARPVQKHGMVVRRIVGYGYGPFTFMEKDVFSDSFSILFSEMVTNLSRQRILAWFSYFANRWVFLVQKPVQRASDPLLHKTHSLLVL